MNLFGLGEQKPHHYREMLKIAWANRDQLPFAWRILNDGVCDGCALGTSGLSDWTLDGTLSPEQSTPTGASTPRR